MLLAALAMAAVAACEPADGLGYVCGPRAAEDVVQLPGTRWLITSGLATDQPGRLWLINERSKRAQPVALRDARDASAAPSHWRGNCPQPPRLELLSMDGLGLHTISTGNHLLFAANHGGRHAIEVFEVRTRGYAEPEVTWTGCVPLPPGTLANAVAPLRNGGLIMASFHDPDDPQAWTRLARGESTGSVWEWQPAAGWQLLDAGPLSGANGLALSRDERTLYISAWAAGRLVIMDRGGTRSGTGMRREMELGFLPDNLHREPDGTLLVAGQRARVADIAACNGPACPQPWVVARVDPLRGKVTVLAQGPGNARIGYACGALRVGDTLYITARGDARLAWLRLRPGG
jgi:hypothetical protein